MPKKVRNLSKLYNLYKNRYLAKCMKLKSALTYSVSGSIQLHLRARLWNRFMRSDHSSFHSNTTELGPIARYPGAASESRPSMRYDLRISQENKNIPSVQVSDESQM